MKTAIIIDDEYYASEGLKMDLEELGQIKVIATYEKSKAALQDIAKLKPDIVFLDIEMPEINGLQMFKKITEINQEIKIVFVTAYNQFAVEAFELNAVDYIVKPIQIDRLKKTLDRLEVNEKDNESSDVLLIECFGYLNMKLGEKDLEIVWRTKKSQELLCYLICHKDRFISKEKIAEIFWPKFNNEKSKSNFHLTYHYLKKHLKEIGFEDMIESKRGEIRFISKNLNLDLDIFNNNLHKLKILSDSNISLAEKTIELYKGMLFEEHYFSWISEMQNEYEIKCISLLEKVVRYYEHKDINKYLYYKNKL